MKDNQKYNGYRFTASIDKRNMGATSKILNYHEFESSLNFNAEEFGKSLAHFRGAILALFGPPAEASSLADEAFSYVMEATDSSGNTIILTAYDGPSGPAIGAKIFHHEESFLAAKALVMLIRSTMPTDFEATIYDDTNSTVAYGCNNGQTYYGELKKRHQKSKRILSKMG